METSLKNKHLPLSRHNRTQTCRGVVSRQQLIQTLTTVGEPLSDNELKGFISSSDIVDIFTYIFYVDFMLKVEETADCEVNCAYTKFISAITGRGLIADP